MIKFELYKNRKTANIVIDKTNLKEKDARGIRRVAQKVCKDVERVTGVCPVIGESLCRTENEVVVAVLGKTSDTDGALAAGTLPDVVRTDLRRCGGGRRIRNHAALRS